MKVHEVETLAGRLVKTEQMFGRNLHLRLTLITPTGHKVQAERVISGCLLDRAGDLEEAHKNSVFLALRKDISELLFREIK